MKDPEICKKEIDEIDRHMVELLVHRLYLTDDLAVYRKANDQPIYDADRESYILKRIQLFAGNRYDDTVKAIFESILKESKKRMMNVTRS